MRNSHWAPHQIFLIPLRNKTLTLLDFIVWVSRFCVHLKKSPTGIKYIFWVDYVYNKEIKHTENTLKIKIFALIHKEMNILYYGNKTPEKQRLKYYDFCFASCRNERLWLKGTLTVESAFFVLANLIHLIHSFFSSFVKSAKLIVEKEKRWQSSKLESLLISSPVTCRPLCFLAH